VRVPIARGRPEPDAGPELSGTARVDKRTKNLVKRLQPGQVAVIDHVDIDKVAADSLVACRPAAVINAAPSISGRYPNLGPEILVAAGVPLVDDVGSEIMTSITEGAPVRVLEGEVWVGDKLVAHGKPQTKESVAAAMEAARAGLAVQLEAFAANTMEYLKRERDLLFDGVGVPDIKTSLDGRLVLVVVRGYD
jgi:uncharacterized membrane-anchored protein